MGFLLKRIKSAIDRIGRNDINENFDKIEKNFNNVVDVVSNRAYEQVVDAAKLIWQEPVDTFADLATNYPNAEEGWASMARDTGIVYRYDGTSGWGPIQQISAGPVNEVDHRLTTQLAQTGEHLSEFKPAGDGVTEDTAKIAEWVQSNENLFASAPTANYVSDEIIISESRKIFGNYSKFVVSQPSKKLFEFINTTNRVKNALITMVEASQPVGTANNHPSLSFCGSTNCTAISNIIKNADLGIRSGYGDSNIIERRSLHNLIAFNYFETIRRMAIEIFGASYSRVIGNSIEGNGGESHGLRITGYGTDNINTKAEGNVVLGTVINGMLNAYSLQNTAKYNSIAVSSSKDLSGHVVHITVPTNSDNTVEFNVVKGATFKDVKGVISNSEGQFNDFELIGKGIETVGIEEIGTPVHGTEGHNKYAGILKDIGSHGVYLRYSNNRLDVDVIDALGVGCYIAANAHKTTGQVKVDGADRGVAIFSNNNVLSLHVTNCSEVSGDSIVISGSNNVITLYTDKNITLAGSNNTLVGYVGGTIEVTAGAGTHDITGVNGYSGRGRLTTNTDTNGQVSIPHGLKTNVLAVMTNYMGALGYTTSLVSISNTNIIVEVRNTTGAIIPNEAVTIFWIAEAIS